MASGGHFDLKGGYPGKKGSLDSDPCRSLNYDEILSQGSNRVIEHPE